MMSQINDITSRHRTQPSTRLGRNFIVSNTIEVVDDLCWAYQRHKVVGPLAQSQEEAKQSLISRTRELRLNDKDAIMD
jgi:hypothetical protein